MMDKRLQAVYTLIIASPRLTCHIVLSDIVVITITFEWSDRKVD